ncbi:hypothetical protein BC829DRAFT_391184, partial [Chytridium lagenaria]
KIKNRDALRQQNSNPKKRHAKTCNKTIKRIQRQTEKPRKKRVIQTGKVAKKKKHTHYPTLFNQYPYGGC